MSQTKTPPKVSTHASQTLSCGQCKHTYENVHLRLKFMHIKLYFVNVQKDSPTQVPENCDNCSATLGKSVESFPFSVDRSVRVNGIAQNVWARQQAVSTTGTTTSTSSASSSKPASMPVNKKSKFTPKPAAEFKHLEQARAFVEAKMNRITSATLPVSNANFITELSNDNWKFLLDFSTMDHRLIDRILDVYSSDDFRKCVKSTQLHVAVGMLIESKFMTATLPRFVRTIISTSLQLKRVVSLIEFCFRHSPNQAADISWLTDLNQKATKLSDADLCQSCERLLLQREQIESGVNPSSNQDFTNQEAIPPIAHIGLVPTREDFERKDPALVENRSHWNSPEDLIFASFRLLREDFLEAIRKGLHDFIREDLDQRNMTVYEDVSILCSQSTSYDLALVVSFKANRFVKRKVEKQLPGSLVVLFPLPTTRDASYGEQLLGATPIYALISTQEPSTKSMLHASGNETLICLNLLDGSSIEQVDFGQRYLMIESPCYFRSVGPVLNTLRTMDPKTLPLREELLLQNLNSELPQYLQEHPIVDLSIIMKGNDKMCDVSRDDGWPQPEETIFDNSQYDAMKTILQKRCAVIRGPPGCGKTYLGSHLVRVLHNHIQYIGDVDASSNGWGARRTSPILVITYTNHALDAFIEPLLEHIPKLVRVGGRSKSPNSHLQERMLNNLVRKRKTWYNDDMRELQGNLQSAEEEFLKLHRMQEYADYFSFCETYEPHLLYVIQDLSFLNKPLIVNEREVFEAWFDGDSDRLVQLSHDRLSKKKKKREEMLIAPNSFAALGDEMEDVMDAENNPAPVDENAHPLVDDDSSTDDGEAERQKNFERVEQEEFNVQHKETLQQFDTLSWQFTPLPGNASRRANITTTTTFREHVAQSEEFTLEQLEMMDHEEQRLERLALADAIDDDPVLIETQAFDFGNAFEPDTLLNTLTERPWALEVAERRTALQERLRARLEIVEREYVKAYKSLSHAIDRRKDVSDEAKLNVLSDAPLIAMTSTCAALHHKLLSRLKCKVCIIEEAAELMEPQVLACMNDSLQHLIMIADERQLRPKCNSHTMATKYQLEISMFERLVRNGMVHSMLTVQQRMRPTISRIVRHFYEDKLRDHPSVLNRPNVPGVSHNVVFITHRHPEKMDMRSHSNEFEAEYSVKLAEYLAAQEGYTGSDITILTAYKGQYFLLKQLLLQKGKLKDVRVSTIDEFQGEENRIIILSLVRSGSKSMGFVKIQNRIIVALSRAREGMFILGNTDLLSQSRDWYSVLQIVRESDDIGFGATMVVHCPRHPVTQTQINTLHDWHQVIHGGCRLQCQNILDCGHSCPMLCHAPRLHDNMRCMKECPKLAPCGEHPCRERCHHGKECRPCKSWVYLTLPCGHELNVECGRKDESHECARECGLPLPCGHLCEENCFGHDRTHSKNECKKKITSTCNDCGKMFSHKCHETGQARCPHRCMRTKDCQHTCSGTCGKCSQRGACEERCSSKCSEILFCNHKCGGNHKCQDPCGKCTTRCSRECPHGRCGKKCSEPCAVCVEPCKLHCPHSKCTKRCGELCDRKGCNKRCGLKCTKCKKQCSGLCGEPCPPCIHCHGKRNFYNRWRCPLSLYEKNDLEPRDLLYQLGCGHVMLVEFLDQHMLKTLDNQGHQIVQEKACPECRQPIQLSHAPRYEKVIKTHWMQIDRIKKKIKDAEEEARRMDERGREEAIAVMRGLYGKGHWFCCPNGHPYIIGDCGGAMMESTCPDCGASVGGAQHTLRSDNRLATEIDGATAPAWPTMLDR